MTDERELDFVEPSVEAFGDRCRELTRQGATRIALRPFNAFAASLLAAVASGGKGPRFVAPGADAGTALPASVTRVAEADAVDATFICAQETVEVSARLMDCLDLPRGIVVAPRTPAFSKSRPLFLISIPKSGTHLLYELAQALGYAPGVVCPADPAPGSWYCVEYSNSHTSARDFFVDTVRRSSFGNRLHPFLRSPALFIYRNPLDILVSEASYYHRDGNTAFYGYLSALSFEERLLKLIDDPWLLGSIRDRIGQFLPWLTLPNVVPVSFEELVGSAGGGSDEVRAALIWSLQLKLHVAGRPGSLGQHLFNPQSATFREGQIGAFSTRVSPDAFQKFFALPQDFMRTLGYPMTGPDDRIDIPRRAEEFRRRPLGVSEAAFDHPIAVEYSYRGFNIVLSQGTYLGLLQSLGAVDVATVDMAAWVEAGDCVRGRSLEEVKAGIDLLQIGRAVSERFEEAREVPDADAEVPRLVEEAYFGFNVVVYRGRAFALRQELGPLDLKTAAIGALEAEGRCLVRGSADEAKRAVLESLLQAGERERAALGEMNHHLREDLARLAAQVADLQAEAGRARAALDQRNDEVRPLEAAHAGRVRYLESALAVSQDTARGLGLMLREREERTAWLREQLEAARVEVTTSAEARLAAEAREQRTRAEREVAHQTTFGHLEAENAELRLWIERLQGELVESKARRGLFRRR